LLQHKIILIGQEPVEDILSFKALTGGRCPSCVTQVLVKRYHSVRVEKDKLSIRMSSVSKDLQKHAALKVAFMKLERAHLSQGAYIQTLQSRQAKIESYKTTIKVETTRHTPPARPREHSRPKEHSVHFTVEPCFAALHHSR
jgi:hypothetical protein